MGCATVMWQQCEEILNSAMAVGEGIKLLNGEVKGSLILLGLIAGQPRRLRAALEGPLLPPEMRTRAFRAACSIGGDAFCYRAQG